MRLVDILKEGLEDHAKYELAKAGLFDKDSDYGGMIGKAVLELAQTFAKQGHSGMSAAWVRELFNKLANYETLTPITNEAEEWNDVTEYTGDGKQLFQNKRNPAVFSKDGGETWYNVNEKTIKEGIKIGLTQYKTLLKEEENPIVYKIKGVLVTNTEIRGQTDILSDIRSLSGITIVSSKELRPDAEVTDNPYFYSELSVKIDPHPYLGKGGFGRTNLENLIKAINRIQGVRNFKITSKVTSAKPY
jgi:hypothetical protein